MRSNKTGISAFVFIFSAAFSLGIQAQEKPATIENSETQLKADAAPSTSDAAKAGAVVENKAATPEIKATPENAAAAVSEATEKAASTEVAVTPESSVATAEEGSAAKDPSVSATQDNVAAESKQADEKNAAVPEKVKKKAKPKKKRKPVKKVAAQEKPAEKMIFSSPVSTVFSYDDYYAEISKGPFVKSLVLNFEQQSYSQPWKEAMQAQLLKPVNFAGHYRLYTAFGGQGKECLRNNWVCGWVIDKFTGNVVSALPRNDDGTHLYVDVSENDKYVGMPFEIKAYANYTLINMTGQILPRKFLGGDKPVCKSITYNFTKDIYAVHKFEKVTELTAKCKISN